MTMARRDACAAIGALALPALSSGQATWPRQSIRFVVPFAPGGTSEIVARTVANELTKQLGQTVFVDNKGGGAGIPAMQEVAKSVPDGHTIILGHVGSLAVNPYIFPSLPYDVNRDFMPVTLLARVPNLFVIHPDVPAKDFAAFVAYVKKNPGKLNYGSAGNASAGHLAMEYLKLVTGMFITHIPYRGTGPQLTDLLAGRTQASSAGLPALMPHIKAGKLRPIAVGTHQRLTQLPDVPTVAEQGYKDFETSQWYGILAPAGTPRDIVKRLQEESLTALKSNAVTERFASDSRSAAAGRRRSSRPSSRSSRRCGRRSSCARHQARLIAGRAGMTRRGRNSLRRSHRLLGRSTSLKKTMATAQQMTMTVIIKATWVGVNESSGATFFLNALITYWCVRYSE
jgi:tripartite-type tricarboxylate transporter receptor subunit TctC